MLNKLVIRLCAQCFFLLFQVGVLRTSQWARLKWLKCILLGMAFRDAIPACEGLCHSCPAKLGASECFAAVVPPEPLINSLPACRQHPECLCTAAAYQPHISHTLTSTSLSYHFQGDLSTLPVLDFPLKHAFPALSWTVQIYQVHCPSKRINIQQLAAINEVTHTIQRQHQISFN